MIYGLYLSAQGAQIQTLRQDVISNNLANAATTAFKRDLALAQSNRPYDVEHSSPNWIYRNAQAMPGGVTPAEVATDFSQGDLKQTNGPLDLAIEGKGFLRVTDGKKTYLTRDGQLALDAQNRLVTRDGDMLVLNPSGQALDPVNPDLPVEFLADGQVMQGDSEVGRMAVVEPQSERDLTKIGRNLYTTSGKLNPTKVESTTIKQGYIESSGVQPVTSMVELITSSRALEANTNLIHFQDDSLSKLLSSLPRK